MNRQHVAAFALLFVSTLVGVAGLPAATPKPDQPNPAAKTEGMTGKEPGDVRDDNGLKTKLVWCPPGKVAVEGDQGGLDISVGFWLGKHEVTQAEWRQVMATEPWLGWGRIVIGDDIAATYVSWTEAVNFCAKLTERERNERRLPAGWQYTLPTEAQWEYGCRAQTTTSFSFGNDEQRLGEYAWYAPKRQTTYPAAASLAVGQPIRVGQKKPNPWGLHDMHGNVWEWCSDGYVDPMPIGRDPETTASDSHRVIRGGSWWNGALECRSARRDRQQPDHSDYSLGFRIALSPSQPRRD